MPGELKALDQMELEAERLNDLIGQMLTLSLIESTGELKDTEAVDMRDLVESMLPDLQFEEGDALIKLSNDPKDWLILHKAVLSAVSPVFRASFSDAWATRSKPDAIVHPVTGKELSLHTLALKAVDDTYLLE